MLRTLKWMVALLLLTAPWPVPAGAGAGGADAARIAAAAGRDARARSYATHLAGEIGARLTGTRNLARAETWARDEFARVGLDDVRLEKWGEYEARRGPAGRPGRGAIAVHNVVADIRGASKPEEYVIVTAHLDSWDFADGATDNAAGVAAVMEAARAIVASGVRPSRTIRFILFTGEEQGLLGATAYVKAHPEVVANASAVLNMDAGTNPISGLVATEATRADLGAALAGLPALDPSKPFELRTVASFQLPADCCSQTVDAQTGTCTGTSPSCAGAEAACPSDHTAFLRAGVPAFIFEQRGSADYGRTHHTKFDTVDALDFEAIQHSAAVIALAAHGIAELPRPLSRANLVAGAPAADATGGAPSGLQKQGTPAACTPSCER